MAAGGDSGVDRAPRISGRGTLPVLADAAEPRTGSYFVSAYPPFSCWSGKRIAGFRDFLAEPTPDEAKEPLGLYLHVPFCEIRCDYCYYLSYDDRPEAVAPYLAALERELGLWAERPALAGRAADFVYFGGGTPSLLSTRRLSRLLPALRSIVPWDGAREVSFECAPRSASEDKLALLAGEGVTRISLGVQQLDDRVLALNRRVHLSADVERAWGAIRRVGFPVVNVDLIAGLIGETEESFFGSLERVIAMAPESVTIYQLEVPLNTPLYRRLGDGEAAAAPPTWEETRERLGRAFARLEEAGFTVRSAYGAVRDPERHPFVYQDAQYRGADVLGVGVSSFSYLGGWHQQSLAALDGYLETLERGELPLGRAYRLSDEERMVRELVLQLKLGRVERGAFRDKLGADPAERFAETVAGLVAEGLARLDDERLELTRAGLLRADELVRRFYLPPHRQVRYS